MSAAGLGRVKTLSHGERLERSSSPASVVLASQVRRFGKRGTGSTRFPSVNALSEFSHNHDHVQSSKPGCAGSRTRLLIPTKLPRADPRAPLTLCAINCVPRSYGNNTAPPRRAAGDTRGGAATTRGKYGGGARADWDTTAIGGYAFALAVMSLTTGSNLVAPVRGRSARFSPFQDVAKSHG